MALSNDSSPKINSTTLHALVNVEEVFEAVMNVIVDGAVLVLDAEAKIVWANKDSGTLLDLPVDSIVGKSFWKTIPLLQLDKNELTSDAHPLARVMTTNFKQLQPFFCLYKPSSGEALRPFVLKVDRVGAKAGSAASYLVYLREAQRKIDLKEMNRSFVSLAAHQLKTPAGVVQGYLEMALKALLMNPTGGQLQKYLSAAYDANRLLIRTAKDLLNATKLVGGLVEPQVTPFDLERKINLRLVGYKQWMMTKHIRFTVDVEMNGDSVVENDQTIVGELFDILLHNSIKFVPDEGSIRLTASRDGGTIELVVQDNGPGIQGNEEKVGAGRIDDMDTAMASGSGLGLHLAKQFARLIKGNLVYEAVQPHGSRFRLQFPDLKQ